MANLQIKNIDDELYAQIKRLAALENRSVSQEVLFLMRDYLAKGGTLAAAKTPASVLLGLSGSWEDERPADEIAHEIRSSRRNSRKLRRGM